MSDKSIEGLIKRLASTNPNPDYLDDENALKCCRLALDAYEQGNYGVAALLLNERREVVAQAENRVFSQGYNSSAHAEMILIDQLEQGSLGHSPAQLTMLVSLEPCPMCLSRLLLSGIGSVRFIANDSDGGMISRLNSYPPAWRNLVQLQNHYRAHVSEPVLKIAEDLAAMNLANLRHKLFMHIGS
ncbi:nucleoside deaminase [Amphritea balenae]|uniref:Nucleoside deaminase n=1 Tax=Amphritea balenae TaxID=452629 RepID=A0A3P1SV98_9GAMM|nr:nucleoside deaminase [Amphritea balenae]RRD01142.1 nucleoside deaminase [Amphritea balenae]GGK59563.1 tRNA-specific adenosine deaminase [Amphritea balenae]